MELTKYVLPVVTGSMVGMILIILGRNMVYNYFPLPPGTDKYDADSVALAWKWMPAVFFRMLLLADVMAAFIGGAIGTLVVGRSDRRPSLVIGVVLTLAELYSVLNLPQPAWYSILSMMAYLPFAFLGYRLLRKNSNAKTA